MNNPCCNVLMIFRQISILICTLLWAALASAAVTAVSVDENTVSGFTFEEPSAGVRTYTIAGGSVGQVGSCATPDSASTCNSCDALNFCTGTTYQCAQRSIHSGLNLAVNLTFDSVPNSPAIYAHWGSDVSDRLMPTGTIPTPAANQGLTVFFKWGDICNHISDDADCLTAVDTTDELTVGVVEGAGNTFASGQSQKFTIKLRIVDSTTNTLVTPTVTPTSGGFSDFKVLPGDAKAYVDDVHRGSTGPSGANYWQAMRVYYAKSNTVTYTGATPSGGDFCSIDYTGSNYKDLAVETKTTIDTTLAEGFVDGLENDSIYIFNIASVDETSIVSGFLDPVALNNGDQTRYVAMPGEVVGLLANKECFIATAAYGSKMESQVQTLREFRNEFLLKSSIGRKFVKAYYQLSPPIAQWIAENEIARTIVRYGLWPMILFAEAALNFGFIPVFLVFVGSLATLVFVLRRWRVA